MSSPSLRQDERPFKYPRTCQIWLDLLPVDLCARIVSRLSHSSTHQTQSPALALASLSPTQASAVRLVCNHAISIDPFQSSFEISRTITSWCHVLENDIRHINVQLPSLITRRDGDLLSESVDAMHDLLALPTIQHALVPSLSAPLRAILAGKSLKRLQLRCSSRGFFDDETINLSRVLQACPLEHLDLECDICLSTPLPCVIHHHLRHLTENNTWNTIRSLQLRTCSRHLDNFHAVLSSFPNLEHLRLERSVPEVMCNDTDSDCDDIDADCRLIISPALEERFNSIKSLHILNYGTVNQYASMLGPRLKVLKSLYTSSLSDITKLDKCPNLESLDLILSRGVEAFFPSSLGSLRSLSLAWAEEGNSLSSTLHKMHPSFLTSLVARNRSLEQLRLEHVDIPTSTIEDLLTLLGDRLVSLDLPIRNSYETPLCRVVRIIKLVMIHNCCISDWKFDSMKVVERYRRRGRLAHSGHRSGQTSHQCKQRKDLTQIDVVGDVLERRLPKLSSSSIKNVQYVLDNTIKEKMGYM